MPAVGPPVMPGAVQSRLEPPSTSLRISDPPYKVTSPARSAWTRRKTAIFRYNYSKYKQFAMFCPAWVP
jgi:hypothetical protein